MIFYVLRKTNDKDVQCNPKNHKTTIVFGKYNIIDGKQTKKKKQNKQTNRFLTKTQYFLLLPNSLLSRTINNNNRNWYTTSTTYN